MPYLNVIVYDSNDNVNKQVFKIVAIVCFPVNVLIRV